MGIGQCYRCGVSEHQWWKALAILGTLLNACWIATVVIPGATLGHLVTREVHISAGSRGLVMLGAFILTLPISSTFATHAARNQRLEWSERVSSTVGLIIASPVAIPRYWWRFLRTPKQTQ